MADVMTVQCPSCSTDFPVDPAKVPEGGVRTQCTVCETVFRVDPPIEEADLEGEAPAVAGGAAVGGGVAGFAAAAAGEGSFETPADEAAVEFFDDPVESFSEAMGGFESELAETEEVEPLPMLEGTEPPAEAPDGGFGTGFEMPAESVEEVTPVAEGEFVAEEVNSDWSMDTGTEWVVETEEAGFGEAVDVERLDTVEEQMRSAQGDVVTPEDGISQTMVPEPETPAMEGFMTGDEVMMPDMDLGGSALEVTPEAPEETPGFGVGTPSDFGGMGEVEVAPAEPAAPEPEPMADLNFDAEPVLQPERDFAAEAAPPAAPEPDAAPAAPEPAPGGFQFGRRDPHDKARRLARVLVSDMITYNPDRHQTALANGTLRADFEEEIGKSWAEYVEQVGQDMAETTNYWTEALNEILAKGEPLF